MQDGTTLAIAVVSIATKHKAVNGQPLRKHQHLLRTLKTKITLQHFLRTIKRNGELSHW